MHKRQWNSPIPKNQGHVTDLTRRALLFRSLLLSIPYISSSPLQYSPRSSQNRPRRTQLIQLCWKGCRWTWMTQKSQGFEGNCSTLQVLLLGTFESTTLSFSSKPARKGDEGHTSV